MRILETDFVCYLTDCFVGLQQSVFYFADDCLMNVIYGGFACLFLDGVLPAAFVFKRSCLPLPGPAKVGQDGLRTGKTQQPEIVAGADSRLRVLYPAAFPCQMETKKENG